MAATLLEMKDIRLETLVVKGVLGQTGRGFLYNPTLGS